MWPLLLHHAAVICLFTCRWSGLCYTVDFCLTNMIYMISVTRLHQNSGTITYQNNNYSYIVLGYHINFLSSIHNSTSKALPLSPYLPATNPPSTSSRPWCHSLGLRSGRCRCRRPAPVGHRRNPRRLVPSYYNRPIADRKHANAQGRSRGW